MYELVRPKKDATIYGYARTANAGIDEVNELNTRKSLDRITATERYADPQPSRILMEFPEIDGDFTGISSDNTNVFASFGFETVDRDTEAETVSDFGLAPPNVFATSLGQDSSTDNFGIGGPNVFAFFGESEAPEREPQPEPEEPEEISRSEPSAWLRMWFANGMGMPKKYEIQARIVEAGWREGRGRIENDPATEEPVNWIERTFDEDWDEPGGDYQDVPYAREIFDGDDPDVEMNVNGVLAEDPEHGILLRRGDESFDRQTELKFFSLNTRTIYVPHLLVGRDTYEFDTENSDPVEEENIGVHVSNLSPTYSGEKTRLNVTVEEKFEQRQFLGIRPTARKKSIENERYLPERSLMYQVEDVRTGLVFFPFDERYTAVSFDGKHYFDLDMNNLFPKREYRIKFKYVDPDTGSEQIFDNSQTFKIE